MTASREPLLRIDSLVTEFRTESGALRAVNGASYHVMPGEAVGVVGESGSGKSATAMSVLRLLPPTARVVSGSVTFDGRDLLALKPREMDEVRGRQISMIFQDPMTALNPVMTIGRQIAEGLIQHHHGMSMRAGIRQAVDLLGEVGIPDPGQRVQQYPHEFSGGMRQRAMIAIAMANRPKLIIADEPTTALDVTIQAQILDLLRRLQREFGSALIFITHDLGVIAEMTDRVVVMYGGRVVESAGVDTAFHDPRHPYTAGLLDSLPRIDDRLGELPVIPGQPPSPLALPAGCAFRPRCARWAGRDACLAVPELLEVVATTPAGGDGGGSPHLAACHFSDEAVLEVKPA
jgi:peptide/nickel transport system ATP-binding protein/oligopeptide transport system ATP-binding protein